MPPAQPAAAAEGSSDSAPGGAAEAAGTEEAPAEEAARAGEPQRSSLSAKIDGHFGVVVGAMAGVLFKEIPLGGGRGAPFIVAWLFIGAVFLTLRLKFVNFTGFRHAIDVVRGKYDDPTDAGEVTHFQALASALSATVGLGNIAGVALAVKMGGPGAVFWMLVAAFFGMTAKFAECTMGLKYRTIDAQGHVLGGPMRYLKDGLTKRGLGPLGGVLAVVFAVFCIGGSFGGGNMFQANQSYSAVNEAFVANVGVSVPRELFGLVMVAAVGVVIVGGFKRIAQTAEKIVPLMCGMYVLASAFIVLTNLDGAVLTMRAFEQSITWFPLVLTVSIVLFAYSTMISWSYYGERCWTMFFGPKSSTAYRVVFLAFVYIGSVSTLTNVLDFSDLMILSMAFPNILGLYLLSGELAGDVRSYRARLASGEIAKRS